MFGFSLLIPYPGNMSVLHLNIVGFPGKLFFILNEVTVGILNAVKPVELGNVIAGKCAGRMPNEHVIISDLTGVAVQDIQITVGIYKALTGSS